jgi:hypothetical protein
MLYVAALVSFSVAFVFTLVLALLLDRRGPGPLGGIVFFFTLLWLAVWAGGVWLSASETFLWGASWLGFLAPGLAVTLILAAVTPRRRRRLREQPSEQPERSPARLAASSWVVMAALLVAILAFYLR